MKMDNVTTVPSHFLLLEFSKTRQLQLLHFFSFLVFYLATIIANLLIIFAITFDYRLHTPMYFFLMNLAMQDLGLISVIVPKSMINSLKNSRCISYFGCVAQVFLFISFIASDFFLLTVMAYDRYVAICHPLHYEMMMNWKTCTEIMILVWVASLLYGMLHTSGTFSVHYCSNTVNQFFCEIPYLLNLSCSGFNLVEVGVLVASAFGGLGCFIFIIVSYVMIFKTVWRIPSVQGRQKAFSTCVPHLIVISMFTITGTFAYLKPASNSTSYLDLVLTILYSILPPLFNPIIYSMRNKHILSKLGKIENLFRLCFLICLM
ncbi:olfactory receptor 14A16-like [Protobothrops mucrosquamatus]|uniref:olfactory receptor 14A16-like n=1 Tax=Protobothrops mucrosquamatus TaxID=103944 RepID=UPI0010FB5822|nr:olfactory receptor 14A16-like [Protobothrops mucrosquamatus]